MKKKFEKICNKYLKKFAKTHDLQSEGWVGNFVGTIVCLSDYFFNFDDIRYFVDNKIEWSIIIGWYDFCLERKIISCKAYIKLFEDYKHTKGFNADLDKFHDWLFEIINYENNNNRTD